jgi:ATP phosphoribosyltransferase regulatory subunit
VINESLLKNDERAVYALRALYKRYGYMPFKMSKFEEYDLYVRNKDFLISDRIITFNDTNGKLLALKPDVTLSIIKNGEDEVGCKQKVFYNENVYRVSGSTHQYKEIMQAGLECIGDIDTYDIFEVVSLAAASLNLISEEFVLDVSHLGVLSALLDESSEDEDFRREAAHHIAEKNPHDLARVCADYGVDADKASALGEFINIYGDMASVIARLEPLCVSSAAVQALGELRALYELLADTPYAARIHFDFSIVNDMNYYNGIVFKGFLDGICEGVLAGGQYDKLMRKMGRRAGAVGFALYLDLLEDLQATANEFDVDVLLLYDEKTPVKTLVAQMNALTADGKLVTAQRAVPETLRYRGVCDMREGTNND